MAAGGVPGRGLFYLLLVGYCALFLGHHACMDGWMGAGAGVWLQRVGPASQRESGWVLLPQSGFFAVEAKVSTWGMCAVDLAVLRTCSTRCRAVLLQKRLGCNPPCTSPLARPFRFDYLCRWKFKAGGYGREGGKWVADLVPSRPGRLLVSRWECVPCSTATLLLWYV